MSERCYNFTVERGPPHYTATGKRIPIEETGQYPQWEVFTHRHFKITCDDCGEVLFDKPCKGSNGHTPEHEARVNDRVAAHRKPVVNIEYVDVPSPAMADHQA